MSADFFTGSRRLITYRRLPEGQVSDVSLGRQKDDAQGIYADDLNEFRRKVRALSRCMRLVSNRLLVLHQEIRKEDP